MHAMLDRYKMHYHKSMFGVFYKDVLGFRKIWSFSFLMSVTLQIVKILFLKRKKKPSHISFHPSLQANYI